MAHFFAYQSVPARALRQKTRNQLSRFMNPSVAISTPEGFVPDWTGLAELMAFEYLDIQNFKRTKDPTTSLLDSWTCQEDTTISNLLDYLRQLRRYDVLEGLIQYIDEDVTVYKEEQKSNRIQSQEAASPIHVDKDTQSCSATLTPWQPKNDPVPKFEMITTDDVSLKTCPQIYDAFVSHIDSDYDFVLELIKELEQKRKLKLCIPGRQLLLGQMDNVVTAELIAHRCRRLILILSPEYLKSDICEFHVKFAHSMSPASKKKKIIPVLAKPIGEDGLPVFLHHITFLSGYNMKFPEYFYQRLSKIVQTPYTLKLDSSSPSDTRSSNEPSSSYSNMDGTSYSSMASINCSSYPNSSTTCTTSKSFSGNANILSTVAIVHSCSSSDAQIHCPCTSCNTSSLISVSAGCSSTSESSPLNTSICDTKCSRAASTKSTPVQSNERKGVSNDTDKRPKHSNKVNPGDEDKITVIWSQSDSKVRLRMTQAKKTRKLKKSNVVCCSPFSRTRRDSD